MDFLLGAARPLPPSADIGLGGQSVGQAAQSCFRACQRSHHGQHHRHRSPDRCLPTGSSKDLDTAKAEFKAAWGRKARPEQLAAAYRDLNIRDDG